MSYNRWMPSECYGTELYHHGVKGMKWGHHLKINAQEASVSSGSGGGGAQEYEEPEEDDPNATMKAYEKWQESQKSPLQKKWEKSEAKKTLDAIFKKIKFKKKRKKKSSGIQINHNVKVGR